MKTKEWLSVGASTMALLIGVVALFVGWTAANTFLDFSMLVARSEAVPGGQVLLISVFLFLILIAMLLCSVTGVAIIIYSFMALWRKVHDLLATH